MATIVRLTAAQVSSERTKFAKFQALAESTTRRKRSAWSPKMDPALARRPSSSPMQERLAVFLRPFRVAGKGGNFSTEPRRPRLLDGAAMGAHSLSQSESVAVMGDGSLDYLRRTRDRARYRLR